jgi:hypothetical protein
VFFLALLITSGCKIIPWFGDYSGSPEEAPGGTIILSRHVEATQALSFSSPQFKLHIPAGALRYNSLVEITRYPMLVSGLNLPKEYKPASELYSINVLPAITTLSQKATLKFTIANAVPGRSYMVAYRGSDGKWNFASPLLQALSNDLVVETLNFSDWLVVERVSEFTGALQQGMQIIASPTAAVASNTGFFESDLEISLNLSANQPINLSPASNQLKMQLSAYQAFSLSVTDPDSPESASKLNSNAAHSITLDLLNTAIATIKTAGNSATCTFIIKLQGIKPSEMPPFIAIKALYTTENAINYSAAQTVTFSEAPAEEAEELPTPPKIVDTLPENGAGLVASNTDIQIVFDQNMNRESVQAAIRIGDRAGNEIAGTFNWLNDRVMTFTPASLLLPATEYAVRFVDGAVGQNELALSAEGEIVFTTLSNEPAELLSYSPTGTEIEYNTPILLKFSRPIDPTSLSFTIEPVIPGDFTTTWNEAKTEVSIVYGSGFASAQNHTFTLSKTTCDIYGQEIVSDYSFSFTSKAYVAIRLIGISPASGSVGIAPDSSFEFTFDKPVSEVDVTSAISITPAVAGGFNYAWSAGSTKLTVSHTNKLAIGTEYLVTIASTAENELITSYAIKYKVVNALQIVETVPTANLAGATTNQAITIRFNNPVNTGTTAIAFNPAPANGYTQAWADGNKTLVLTPNSPGLAESLSYQVSILTATTDVYGSSLAQNYVLAFSTGAFTQPEVSNILPENNSIDVALSQQIRINFSKSMDKAKTQAAFSILPVAATVFSWQNSDSTLLIDFSTPLTAGTNYQLALSTEATDNNGLRLAQAYASGFSTIAASGPEPEPDPTILVEYEPADSATPVDPFTPVILRFSAPINPDTLSFEVSPTIAGDYTTTWNDAGTEASIRFNSGYSSGFDYTFSVLSSTKDVYGKSITEPADFTFKAKTYSAARLLSIAPASGSANIRLDSAFVLTFDRAMNTSSANEAITFTPPLPVDSTYQWSDADTRLTITPAANLLESQKYQLQIAQTALAADASELVASYQITWQTAARLKVSETVPADNSAGISLKPSVTIRFNNQIDKTKFAMTWSPEPSSGFSQTWSENDTLLTLAPAADLLESQKYLITVKQASADTLGTTLASDYLLNFTTGAVTAPAISTTTPSAGAFDVAVNQQIKISFSKTMDKAKTQAAVSVNPSATSVFSWQDNDTTVVISLGSSLSYDTSYQITVGTGATDKFGLSLAENYLLGFKTVARPSVLTSKCYPVVDSTGIPPQAVIKVEFSKAMNKTSAETAFSLKQGVTAIGGSFSWSGNIMSFTPASSLAYGTLHQISIAGTALDSLGNSLSARVNWTFTTASDEGKAWTLEQADTENTTTFSQRSEHVMISFNNKLWVIGGFDGWDYLNDVWSSSDGKIWTRESAAAAFPARSAHACVVYDGKIWMTGGYSDSAGLFDDVWNSSDGRNWVRVSSSAAYYARSAHSMAVFANKLWIIGGESLDSNDSPVLLDDCWSSSNGSSWQSHSSIVTFFPRKLHTSGVVNNRLWIWGGFGEDADANKRTLNDVWSTADGEFWRLETSSAAFPARCAAASTAFNNRIWLIGGAGSNPYIEGKFYYNDVWASSDGSNWVQILGDSAGGGTQFSRRVLHGAAALSDKLFISGGELSNYFLNNEVWSTK